MYIQPQGCCKTAVTTICLLILHYYNNYTCMKYEICKRNIQLYEVNIQRGNSRGIECSLASFLFFSA